MEQAESSSASSEWPIESQSSYPLQRIAYEGSDGELTGILAFGSTAGMIGLFNLATYNLMYINYGDKPIVRVEFSRGGLLFIAHAYSVTRFDCTDLARIRFSYSSGWSSVVDFCLVTLDFYPFQEFLCVLQSNNIHVFDTGEGKSTETGVWSLNSPDKNDDKYGPFTCIAATRTGLILVGETSGNIRVWSWTTTTLKGKEYFLQRSTITAIVTSPSTWIGAGNRKGAIISYDYNDSGLRDGFRLKDGEDGEVIDIKFPRNFSGCPTVAFKSCIAEYNPDQRAITWKKRCLPILMILPLHLAPSIPRLLFLLVINVEGFLRM